MAEAVLSNLAQSRGHAVIVDSAGTGAYHEGDDPDSRTMRVLRDNGIRDYEHAARKVQLSDFHQFDYVLAMDRQNLHDLQRMMRRTVKNDVDATASNTAKVMLFGDFGGHKGEEVGDPYYGARDGFTIAYEQMKRFSEGFLKQIVEDNKD